MNKLVSLALLSLSLAASARAIIIGADVGYLVDGEEEYISARLGHAFKSDTSLAHQVELEIGYTSHAETVSLLGVPVTATSKITPVTLNYRAETLTSGKLGYYFGAGAGLARASFSMPGSGVSTISDSGSALALQAFTGLSYQVAPAATLHFGVKYIWIDDVELFGIKAEVGDDVVLSAGVSFKF